jgi:hypothetical protein
MCAARRSLRTAVLAARSPLSLHPSPFLKLLSLNPNLMHTPISIIFWIQPYSSSQLALQISPLQLFSKLLSHNNIQYAETALRSHSLRRRRRANKIDINRPSARPSVRPPHHHRRQPPVHRWIKKSLSLSRAPSLSLGGGRPLSLSLSRSLARLRRLYYFLID